MTKQQEKIAGPLADRGFTAVEVTWAVYQDIVTAYRNEGKKLLQRVIDTQTTNLPSELIVLK